MEAPMDRLVKRPANHPPLSPVNFLKRAATAYADRTSVIYGRTCFTWKQTYERCLRLASSLRSLGVSKNDVVSVFAPNIPAVYEMHFGVPFAGAVLNTINTRLDAGNVANILVHSEARVFFVDYQYVKIAADAIVRLSDRGSRPPVVVLIDDVDAPTGARLGELEYEQLLARGDPACPPVPLRDEWDAIALNYTSGTTAAPKGVVCSHRGAYLSTLSALLQWEVGPGPIYLWSLPMFHCNGWTFPWGVAARGGINVCIRRPTAHDMYRAIADHGVTHLCAAPTVLIILLEGGAAHKRSAFASPVKILTGGAPPPPPVIEEMERMGFDITHSYGLTEASGSGLVCEWRQEWDLLPLEKQARLKVRQGVSVLSLADVDVKDVETMASVPHDGETVGEIMLRGSNIMKGYYKNAKDTEAAFKGDWFLTGDLGVVHPDGYVEIKDRAKDVIISGGENISSVELETVLYRHPMVLEAAVVAMPHPRWGETPCAFVKLKEGGAIKEEEIITHCRSSMSGFMVPKKVVFMDELPKTSTGKIRKFLLRDMARALYEKARKAVPPPPAELGYGNGSNHEPAAPALAMSRL